MKLLSIGNSFSEDAQRYLHNVAKANGEYFKCVNLYIGGCTLRRHYLNMLDDEKAYIFTFNGEKTDITVSAREVLKSDDWDIITLQQGSHESFNFDFYTPYIEYINEYVKKYSPKSKIFIHKTWAYPDNKKKLFEIGYNSTAEMFKDVNRAYSIASDHIKADGIIPSGDAMLKAYETNRDIVYRDDIHASLGFGRYMLSLAWYLSLSEHVGSINHITEFDVPVTDREKELAYKIAHKTVNNMKKNIKEA